MVTELDLFGIKERIVAIMQNDTDLYTNTAEANKLRRIVAGFSDDEKVLPMAFITNSQNLEAISPVSVISNAWNSLTHTIDFEIHVIVNGKSSQAVEEKLDDFRKLIYEVIEENNQLKNPSTGLDPVVATSWPMRLRHEGRGTLRQEHIITLHCIAVS